jgi:hypothetical protein
MKYEKDMKLIQKDMKLIQKKVLVKVSRKL